jgi:hypothetical protein
VLPSKAIERIDSDHEPTAEGALCAGDSFNATDGANYTERERKSGLVMGERGWIKRKVKSKSQEEKRRWDDKSE